MQRLLLTGAACAAVLSMGVVRQATLADRLASLEEAGQRAPQRDAALAATLQREVSVLASELEGVRAELERARGDEALTRQLDARLAAVDGALGDAIELLALQDDRLALVGEHVTTLQAAAATEVRLEALELGVEQRWRGLSQAMEATTRLVADTRAEARRATPSPGERWDRTLGPTVQLAGDTTVGSGVLLESRRLADGRYETLLLTCWHVVRDIQADGRGADAAVPVAIYAPDGSKRDTSALVVGANADIDACLLRLVDDSPVPHGAWLPSRARLAASNVFDPIVAVGCPLGNDPIPTTGNLSSLHHEVERHRFWMISAPTYIGNSGGGIFGAEDHRLLGLFSKIYTHGSLRPVIVPHMGLVTPLGEVYDWLEASRLATLVEGPDGGAQLVLRGD